MKKHKPLNLLDDKGFWPEKAAILDGIKELLALGKCDNPPPVRDFGNYRGVRWRDEDENLVPYQSVDWYVFNALNEDRMQVDTNLLLESFEDEPWRDDSMLGDHYDLFIIEEDLYDSRHASEEDSKVNYAVGKADKYVASVVSTHRIDHIWGMPYSYLKTEIMRQVCFMFGVPAQHRDDVEFHDGTAYCKNSCILGPARIAPDDWQKLTEIRLEQGPLCEACLEDLKTFFAELSEESA